MKKSTLLVLALILSATVMAQNRPLYIPQYWYNQPAYSSGGYSKVVLNSTTGRIETTTNTLLSGKLVVATEKDSARNYNFTGSALCYVKFTVRDTVNLVTTSYASNQIFTFVVIASGADTTVFIPSSGTVDAATSYTMTGTRNSISFWYDGTNYWIRK